MNQKKKKTIGIIGGISHAWVSVDRTRRFYLEALQNDFDFVFIDNNEKNIEIDLLINFYGIEGWTDTSYTCPKLLCIHGGTILNQDFLIQNLKNITDQDALVVTCTSDIEIIKSFCKDKLPKIYLLPLPVNQEVFFSIPTETAKTILEMDVNAIHVGLVSRLLPQKNPHIFVQIFKKLKKETNKNIKAFIIGDYWLDYPVLDYVSEDYPIYLKNLIDELDLEDDILFLPGNLSDPELNCLYNAMDLLIHPTNSLDENFGYVPVEAMACATPVVGSHYGGLKDTVNETVGIGIPTYTTKNGIRMDIDGVFSKITGLLQQENHEELRENCLERVENLFSYNVFKKDLNAYVSQLITEYNPNNKVKIQTIDITNLNGIEDNLPKTTNGINWNDYKPVVEKYVSHTPPVFKTKDYVYVDCDYFVNETRITRDDPAWPASYDLTPEEFAIFDYCKKKNLHFESCATHEFNISTVQQLVDEGVLVISKSEWR